MENGIRILITGGTFDKEYNERTGQLYFKETHLPEMLRLGRSRVEVNIRTVMMIDSLDMTDSDRALIVQNCVQAPEERIVITHGTDTMTETAAAVAAAIRDKTVVVTGAMIPYAFGSSDGLFNLGSALSFVQVLPHGVYIAMNGKCFPWDRCRKTAIAASSRRWATIDRSGVHSTNSLSSITSSGLRFPKMTLSKTPTTTSVIPSIVCIV